MKKFDVIIIGGGHNGLVASSYLSKKGKKVLVIEKNENVGGLAAVSYTHLTLPTNREV